MGQMRFDIPLPERLVPDAADQAYLAGPEGIPWECVTVLAGNLLSIERETRESGYLYFPWNVPGRGVIMLTSGSLMERPKPYHLPVELARGTLNRLRNQVSLWEAAGMVLPESLEPLVHRATAAFARAATGQGNPIAACEPADEAIRLGLEASDLLTQDYARQVIDIRRSQQQPLGTLLGARLQVAPNADFGGKFLATFNTAMVSPVWHDLEPKMGKFQWDALDAQVQWCRDQNLRLCFGPLMQFDRHLLPDWLFLDDEFEEVQLSAVEFIDALVKRYRGKVQLWHVAARMNQEGAFKYSEEQRLRLVVEAVDRVRALDAKTPMILSFDQPWGEYIIRQDQELTPLHFADTLVRGELGLAGIGLEINLGYWPGGTLPRDALEVSRQLDRWSQIGVPLIVYVTAPSSSAPDPLARHPARPLPNLRSGGVTPAWQHVLLQWLLPLLLAKQQVQAIAWDCWQDNQPHEMPSSGLYDSDGHAKPALQTLIELRREIVG